MNELTVVAENQLDPQLKGDIDQVVAELVQLHQANRGEINRLAFETVSALSAADARSQELSSQGTLRRWWGNLTGKNASLRNAISQNHTAALYAMQSTMQKLAEQNLLSFELTAAVNNRLNGVQQTLSQDINAVHQDLNKTCEIMLKFFRQTQSNLLSIEERLDNVEQSLDIIDWMAGIEYKAFQGTPYAELSDIGKLVCVITDFYEASRGHWQSKDLPKIKRALSDVGLQPQENTTYRKFFMGLAAEPEYQQLICDTAQLVKAEPVDMAMLTVLKKRQDYQQAERYQVQSLQKIMQDKGIETTEQEMADTLVENYVTEMTGVSWDSEITQTNLALELLFNIHQSRILAEQEPVVIEADAVLAEASVATDSLTSVHEIQVYDYDEEKLLAACEDGDGCAAYQLAVFACQPEKSKQYLEQGMKDNDIFCRSIYRRRYQAEFVFGEEDYRKLLAMAEQGNVLAEYELYCWAVLQDNKPAFVSMTVEDASTRLRHSAQCDFPAALYEQAESYLRAGEAELAAAQHKRAAAAGYLSSQEKLAEFYYQGIGVPKNLELAWQWIQKPADEGQMPVAKYFAAAILISRPHEGVEDEDKALVYLKEAYAGGFVEAGKAIGDWYAMHLGKKRGENSDLKQALECYKEAAAKGSIYAQIALGLCRQFDILKNGEDEEYYYKKAVESGDAVAIKYYADYLFWGKKEISSVYQEYQKAAKLGLREAQYFLADMYEGSMERYYPKVRVDGSYFYKGKYNGEAMREGSLTKDIKVALTWREKAAKSHYIGMYAIVPYRLGLECRWGEIQKSLGQVQADLQRSLEGDHMAIVSALAK